MPLIYLFGMGVDTENEIFSFPPQTWIYVGKEIDTNFL